MIAFTPAVIVFTKLKENMLMFMETNYLVKYLLVVKFELIKFMNWL